MGRTIPRSDSLRCPTEALMVQEAPGLLRCDRCRTRIAVATILAPEPRGDSMRRTRLCLACQDEWHGWLLLIYGKTKDPTHAL